MKRKAKPSWDESWQPIEYLAEAEQLGVNGLPRWLGDYRQELVHALAHSEKVLRSLSTRDNWAVERPAIFLDGHINQAGSLSLRWRPAFGDSSPEEKGEDQFTKKYLYEALRYPVGNYRPDVELLYVRRFMRSFGNDATPQEKGLVFAGWSAYLSIVKRVGQFLEVVEATPLRVDADDSGPPRATLGSRVHPFA